MALTYPIAYILSVLALSEASFDASSLLQRAASRHRAFAGLRYSPQDPAARTLLTLDTNNDGNIDPDEVAAFARSQGLDAASATQEFSSIDGNGDGVLDSVELQQVLAGSTTESVSTEAAATPAVAPVKLRSAATEAAEVPVAEDETLVQQAPLAESAAVAKQVLVAEDATLAQQAPLAESAAVAKQVPVAEDATLAQQVPLAESSAVAKHVPVAEDATSVQQVPLAESAAVAKQVPVAEDATLAQQVPLAESSAVAKQALVASSTVRESPSLSSTDAGSTELISQEMRDSVRMAARKVAEELALEEKEEREARNLDRQAAEIHANSTKLAKQTAQDALDAGAKAAHGKAEELLAKITALEEQAEKAEVRAAALRAKSKMELEEGNQLMAAAEQALKPSPDQNI
jgi:hypothetical protein